MWNSLNWFSLKFNFLFVISTRAAVEAASSEGMSKCEPEGSKTYCLLYNLSRMLCMSIVDNN
jgi:hypothetical protein